MYVCMYVCMYFTKPHTTDCSTDMRNCMNYLIFLIKEVSYRCLAVFGDADYRLVGCNKLPLKKTLHHLFATVFQ